MREKMYVQYEDGKRERVYSEADAQELADATGGIVVHVG